MKLSGFATRKFPLWLQAFNALCAFTALGILAFGAYHLLHRADPGDVSAAALAQRLETREGGSALGKALLAQPDAEAARVLDEAMSTCLPGGVALAYELAARESPAGKAAEEELAALVSDKPVSRDEARAGALRILERFHPRDVTLVLAARAVVQGSPYRRRAAVDRLAALGDGRAGPALLAALGTPEPEGATRAAAEKALAALAGREMPPVSDGTAEDRWTAWWDDTGKSTFLPPPYDVTKLAAALVPKLEASRDALRGVGIARLLEAAPAVGRVLLTEKDPTVRVIAAWSLGRIGGKEALEPLRIALGDPSAPLVRAAAARAIGKARCVPLEADLVKLLDAPEEPLRVAAAFGLLGFMNRSGLRALDAVAFDPKRSPAERLELLLALEEAGDGASASSRWIAALSDPDKSVRNTARAALARRVSSDQVLVGRPAWERWWRERYAQLPDVAIPPGIGE